MRHPATSTPPIATPRRGVLAIFRGIAPRRQYIVVGCLLLASLAEGVGIASLLPVLSLAAGDAGTDQSPIHSAVTDVLGALGLPVDIGVLLLIVVFGLLAKSALILLTMNYVGYVVAEIATGLRLSLVERLLEVRWSYFTKQPIGRFANAISGEATRASQAFLSVSLLIAGSVQTVVYLLLALLISWKLCLLAAVIGSVMILALNRVVNLSRRAGKQQTRHTQTLVARLTDLLGGIKALKAMTKHLQLGILFAGYLRDLNTALRKQVFGKQAARNLQEPMIGIFLAGALYVAITVWHLPVAELIVMGLLLTRTVAAVGKAQLDFQSAAIHETAYWNMLDTIAEAREARETLAGSETPSLARACEFDRVSFAFGAKQVLADVSLTIPAGKVTTIIGSSGAGKTTIADLILGLYEPDSGDVRLDGRSLRAVDLLQWRGMVGYVPQEVILFHDTVLANVTLDDPALTREDAKASLEAAGAWDFVSRLAEGIDSIIGERGGFLSGGQRQRIAVARALIHRPTLIILDEATSALDPETEAAICRNLRELSERSGLTLLAISHQPAWVDMADRVYQIQDERVVEMPRAAIRVAAS